MSSTDSSTSNPTRAHSHDTKRPTSAKQKNQSVPDPSDEAVGLRNVTRSVVRRAAREGDGQAEDDDAAKVLHSPIMPSRPSNPRDCFRDVPPLKLTLALRGVLESTVEHDANPYSLDECDRSPC